MQGIMDYHTIQVFVILLGAALSLIIALMQALLVKKTSLNYLLILVFINIAIFHISGNFFIFHKTPNWHVLFVYARVVSSTSSFTLLPLCFLWLHSLLKRDLRIRALTLLHFLPALVNVVVLVFFGHIETNTSIAPEFYKVYLFENNIVYRISSFSTFLQSVLYVIWLLILFVPVVTKASKEKRINLQAALLVVGFMLFSIVVYLDYYLGKRMFIFVMQSRMTIFTTVIFIASFRYPFVLNIIKLEAYRDEYIKSRITGIDSDAVALKIEEIMDQGLLYRNSNITIKTLAKELLISPHQLSEIINAKMGVSFPQYIKHKRVEAAKTLIEDQPQDKLISIALDCGFNSLSSFNDSFKTLTGMTPSDFRAKNRTVSK